MKTLKLICLLVLILSGHTVSAQERPKPEMKKYTFVMLTKGNNRTHPPEEVKVIQEGHMKHLSLMAEQHGLNIAGPFLDDGFWRGILIFDHTDTVKIKSIVEMDPAVKSGRLSYEMHPWFSQKGATLR